MISDNLRASFVIISTIIGLGIFVLPYVFFQSGYFFIFWLFFWFLVFFLLHLIFGEILIKTNDKHNLPGLAAIYLHPSIKHVVWFFDYFGMMGVFLIYFIALTKFWSLILPINPLVIKIIFALFNLYFIFKDIKILVKMESILTVGIFFVFIFIVAMILPSINLNNLSLALKNSSNFFLPYGVLLFAFSGISALPVVIDIIGKDKKNFLKVNFYSLLIIFIIYLIYAFSVVGFLGDKVSEESLQSLAPYLPKLFLILAVIFVTLNITFVDMAFYLKRGLVYDYNLKPKFINFLITCSILPLVFWQPFSFISLIGIVSEIFLAFNLLIICLIYLKLNKNQNFSFLKIMSILLTLIFVFGIIYGLFFK